MSELPSTTPPSPRRANRRSSPRRPVRPSSKVICYANSHGLGRNIALAVLDVSETGVRLRLKDAVKPGQEVQVVLLPPGHGREFKLPGVVVWCVAADDGSHLAGIRFEKALSYAVVQDMGKLSTL